jgi:hypothetical protein
LLAGAVNRFRERIERIQAEIKREKSHLGVIIRSIRYRNPLTAFLSKPPTRFGHTHNEKSADSSEHRELSALIFDVCCTVS